MDHSEPSAESNAFLPPILRAERENASRTRGPWYATIGPAYLGLFVWAPFFDALWVGDFTRFSLSWLIAGAVIASLLCFGLFYFVTASWGFRVRQPLGIVAASTFGTTGSEWLTGVMVGFAAVVWYAVAIDYAVESTFLGLRSCGLLASGSVQPWNLGPIVVKSPVYLCTAVFWIYITGTAGLWQLTGVVVALMRVYAPVALILLTGVATLAAAEHRLVSPGVGGDDRVASRCSHPWREHSSVVPLVVSFFALPSLASVGWGAKAVRRRDILLGGLSGIVLAVSWTAIMSLLVVAGTVGKLSQERTRYQSIGSNAHVQARMAPATSQRADGYSAGSLEPLYGSFRWAVYHGIGGAWAGAILILFGLAALAPACYATWIYGQNLSIHWPLFGQWGWTWIGGAIALVLGATSWATRLDAIFVLTGVVFAPAVGAMAGDWLRQRGAWGGIRLGVNRAGVIAWAGGVAISLALELRPLELAAIRAPIFDSSPWWQLTAIWGFVASFCYYWLLAGFGREQPAVNQSTPGEDSTVRIGSGREAAPTE